MGFLGRGFSRDAAKDNARGTEALPYIIISG